MVKIGLPNFISKTKAIEYYAEYCYGNTVLAVERKIKEGEIFIGKPELKDNETVYVNDEGRYIKIIRG